MQPISFSGCMMQLTPCQNGIKMYNLTCVEPQTLKFPTQVNLHVMRGSSFFIHWANLKMSNLGAWLLGVALRAWLL